MPFGDLALGRTSASHRERSTLSINRTLSKALIRFWRIVDSPAPRVGRRREWRVIVACYRSYSRQPKVECQKLQIVQCVDQPGLEER